jgi:hypothetical protein
VIDGDLPALGAGLERIMDDDLPGLNDGLENVRPDGLLGLTDGLDPRDGELWLGDMDWRPAVIRSDSELLLLLLSAEGAAPTCIKGPDSSVMMTTTAIPAALRSFRAPAVIIVVSFPSPGGSSLGEPHFSRGSHQDCGYPTGYCDLILQRKWLTI